MHLFSITISDGGGGSLRTLSLTDRINLNESETTLTNLNYRVRMHSDHIYKSRVTTHITQYHTGCMSPRLLATLCQYSCTGITNLIIIRLFIEIKSPFLTSISLLICNDMKVFLFNEVSTGRVVDFTTLSACSLGV